MTVFFLQAQKSDIVSIKTLVNVQPISWVSRGTFLSGHKTTSVSVFEHDTWRNPAMFFDKSLGFVWRWPLSIAFKCGPLSVWWAVVVNTEDYRYGSIIDDGSLKLLWVNMFLKVDVFGRGREFRVFVSLGLPRGLLYNILKGCGDVSHGWVRPVSPQQWEWEWSTRSEAMRMTSN